MALYLGSEKLGVTIPVSVGGSSGVPCATGTIVSDENGVITFPELDFTPKIIAVWNVEQVDLMELQGGTEWDESSVRYIQRGIMLLSVFDKNMWFSQVMYSNSDSMVASISGESADLDGDYEADNLPLGALAISVVDNRYRYHLHRRTVDEVANTEFNYAIYG